MGNKSKYRSLCAIEKSIPIFSRDWWLDAVCGEENWDVIIIEKGGIIVAAMPYALVKQWGFTVAGMPLLTQKLGPWIKYPDNQSYAKRLEYEKKIINKLVENIPHNIARYTQNFDYSVTNWQPFYWNNFTQSTRYTYVIENLSDLNNIYKSMQSKIRTDIKKSLKFVHVEISNNIEEFYKINKMTFARQGRCIPYSLEFLGKLDAILLEKHARRIYIAKDNEDRIHAAIYIIWDEDSTYYLMGGGDPELRNSGATSLLIWEAIKFASTVSKKFDLEGSMLEPVERFFRGFGTVQKPYFTISKTFDKRMRAVYIFRDMVNLLRGR